MPAEVKFCGITRAEDAAEAARLGAGFVGAIFAGGPRLVDPARAAENFASLPGHVRRVGVFGAQSLEEIAYAARAASLDVVQLHDDPSAEHVSAVGSATAAKVWAVLRIEDSIPADAYRLAGVADGILLDARVDGRLGGTGRALAWGGLASSVRKLRAETGCTVVLAGGLTAENVGTAIEALEPDIVDVSSGVERAPGFKDHQRMRAFMHAVHRAGAER